MNVMLTTRPVLFLSVNSDADINNSDLKQQQEKANVSLGIQEYIFSHSHSHHVHGGFFLFKKCITVKMVHNPHCFDSLIEIIRKLN